jgi:DNA-binding transcriptional regulator GbsR (MarR family)
VWNSEVLIQLAGFQVSVAQRERRGLVDSGVFPAQAKIQLNHSGHFAKSHLTIYRHSVISVLTETTDHMLKLSPVMQKFILHWGEMGTRWGINRTVAQIHALLFISPSALSAEDIAETLSVARSNVSTSLKELQGWRIVRMVHVLGDRRAHFESMKDVWQMFHVIMEERKRREVDPTVAVLRECVAEAAAAEGEEKNTRERLDDMLEFLDTMSSFYEEFQPLPVTSIRQIVKFKGNLRKALRFQIH